MSRNRSLQESFSFTLSVVPVKLIALLQTSSPSGGEWLVFIVFIAFAAIGLVVFWGPARR